MKVIVICLKGRKKQIPKDLKNIKMCKYKSKSNISFKPNTTTAKKCKENKAYKFTGSKSSICN